LTKNLNGLKIEVRVFWDSYFFMKKDFQNWHKIKADIDQFRLSPFFREREIWWCSLGANVGY